MRVRFFLHVYWYHSKIDLGEHDLDGEPNEEEITDYAEELLLEQQDGSWDEDGTMRARSSAVIGETTGYMEDSVMDASEEVKEEYFQEWLDQQFEISWERVD